MKILIVSAAFRPHPGGVSTHVTDLTHGLVNRGHHVYVSTLRKGAEFKLEGAIGKTPLVVWKHGARQVNEFDGRRVFLQDILEFLQHRWGRIRPDLIHVHDFDSLYVGWMLKTAFGVPMVLTVHHAPRQWRDKLYQERAKTCFLEAFRSSNVIDAVIVPSEASREVLHRQGFGSLTTEVNKLKVIPHGIGRHLTSNETDLKLIETLGLSSDRVAIFCPTRADVHKDVATFVRAAAILKKSAYRRHIFLVATKPAGEDYKLVSAQARELGLIEGEEIIFREFSYPEMATVYTSSSACVVPSPRESFGLTVLEAFLFGVPVVAANAAALPEIVRHGKNGLLFEVGDHDDLAKRVKSLLDNSEFASRIGNAGKGVVREGSEYSVTRMVRDHEEFFAEVAAA